MMTKCDHVFILKCLGAFNGEKHVHLVLDLCLGGELFTYLSKVRRLKQPAASLYAGMVASALGFLSARKIGHRDLKLENLLFDEYGYLKLVDFGFAKKVTDRTYTRCGTPDYTAPEMLLNQVVEDNEEEMSEVTPLCFSSAHRYAMPRSLNEPDGCSASIFSSTLVPISSDSGADSRRGVLKWQPGGMVTRVLSMRSAGERGRTASSGIANRPSIEPCASVLARRSLGCNGSTTSSQSISVRWVHSQSMKLQQQPEADADALLRFPADGES